MSVQLPRELLKWIQSLDLSLSVRNVKRDFANGFLIAEILSRYYSKDISMHSFENGKSNTTKFNNWNQLRGLFRKINFEIANERDVIEAVIESRSGDTVIQFMLQLYTFLTSRKVSMAVFQRPPGNTPVGPNHELSKQIPMDAPPNLQDSISTLQSADAPDMNDQLDDSQVSIHKTPSKVLRGQTRTVVGAGEPSAQVVIKKVGVKTLDRDIVSIRASRDVNHSGGTESLGKTNTLSQSYLSEESLHASRSSTRTVSRALLEELDQIISESGGTIKPVNATAVLAAGIQDHSIEESTIADIFKEIRHQNNTIAFGCISQPTDFPIISNMLLAVLHRFPPSSPAFEECVRAFNALANTCASWDAHLAWNMFCDFLLEKITQFGILKQSNDVWKAVSELWYNFGRQIDPTLYTMLQKLRECIADDIPNLLRCLAHICEIHSEAFEDKLVQPLFFYYATTGLSHAAPSIRALSINIISQLASRNDPSVLTKASVKLENLYDDQWWEVQTQLLLLGVTVLKTFSNTDDQEVYNMGESLILAHFNADYSWQSCKIAFCAVAPIAHTNPLVFERFISLLSDLPICDVGEILEGRAYTSSFDSEEPVATTLDMVYASELNYELALPPFSWDALKMAQGFCGSFLKDNRISSRGKLGSANSPSRSSTRNAKPHDKEIPSLNEKQLMLIYSTFRSIKGCKGECDYEWTNVFASISDRLVTSVKDESVVRQAVLLLELFALDTAVEVKMLQHPQWPAMLNKLFVETTIPECSQVVVHFLLTLQGREHKWKIATRALLEDLTNQYPGSEDKSYVRKLLQAVE